MRRRRGAQEALVNSMRTVLRCSRALQGTSSGRVEKKIGWWDGGLEASWGFGGVVLACSVVGFYGF